MSTDHTKAEETICMVDGCECRLYVAWDEGGTGEPVCKCGHQITFHVLAE